MQATATYQRSTGGIGKLLVLFIVATIAVGLYTLANTPAPVVEVEAVEVANDIDSLEPPAQNEYWTDAQIVYATTAGVIVDEYSHRHEEDSDVINACFAGGRYTAVFRTLQPGRFLRVCWDGTFLVFQVVDQVGRYLKERTAYINNEIEGGLRGLGEYIKDARYTAVKGLPR